MVSYSKINYKNISGVLVLCVMIFFITMNILILFEKSSAPIYGIVALTIANLITTCYFIYGITTKIMITNESVTQKSIFKQQTIKWKDIKSYGVYVDIRRNRYLLEEKDDIDFYLGPRLIFVSDISNFTIDKYKIRHKNNSVFIDFSYQKEAFELIRQKMTNLENSN